MERRLKVRPCVPAVALEVPVVWLLLLVLSPRPVSAKNWASSQKEADMPPPRSSVPRKPIREVLNPPLPSRVMSDTVPRPNCRVASTMPKIVTEDWAEAAPAAARTARAIKDFFMQVSPRLNIGAPLAKGSRNAGTLVLPPSPGANLPLGSCRYCTRRLEGE